MSLKIFHVIFIIASILLSVWYGIWAIKFYLTTQQITYGGMGFCSFMLAIALIVYLNKVVRKLKV